MGLIINHSDIIWILVGSLLGSIKASVEADKHKDCLARGFDILLGWFIGTTVAVYYGSHFEVALTVLIAVIGGASGALAMEIFMQMLPNLVKKFVKSWADKLK